MVYCNYYQEGDGGMQHNYLLTNRNFCDLNPLVAGEHSCNPGHKFGPAVRKYTLIHFVTSGIGTIEARGKTHRVQAGQAFLILPEEITTYEADHLDPWCYHWIGFDGTLSERFRELPVVFTPRTDPFAHLDRLCRDPSVAEYHLAAQLFELYASLFTAGANKNPHVTRVENYIRSSYMHPIRVEHIAEELRLDRRYLARLFKSKTGQSMQDFLVEVRMEESIRLLEQGCTVGEAAHLVGYEDVSNYSKMFKKHFGKNPSEYKQ